MTVFIGITEPETDPDAPLTSSLAKRWRDNPIAIAEGDLTAPVNSACWHPVNMVFGNDGLRGLIYNGTTQAVITTSTMEDGYDYMIRANGLSHNAGASRDFVLTIGGLALTIPVVATAANTASFTLFLESPTQENSVRFVYGAYRTGAGTNIILPNTVVTTTFSAAITTVDIALDASGSFDAGQVFFNRRRNYTSI